MPDYGITPEGFNKKTLEVILQDLSDSQKAKFGALYDTAANTAQGQLNGIFGSAHAELWELLEEVYHGMDPDAAAGYVLTALASLTGTERRAAKASVSRRQQLTLDPGASVPARSLVAYDTRPDIVFALDAAVENPGLVADDFEVTATCTVTGPISVPAGALTVIVNPVSGWTATENLADAELGRDVDSDIILRQRREAQLSLRGGSTVGAIRADLLELPDVRSARVIENTTDATVDGLPPHSFEAVIDDGDTPTVPNDTIAQVIWDSKPGGIATYGNTSGTATDENGDEHTVNFSRVTLRPVYIVMALTTTDDFPVDGIAQVKDTLALFGAQYGINQTVIALALRAAALDVAGVVDVPTFALGFSPGPVAANNLSPGARARATFSTTNMIVTV